MPAPAAVGDVLGWQLFGLCCWAGKQAAGRRRASTDSSCCTACERGRLRANESSCRLEVGRCNLPGTCSSEPRWLRAWQQPATPTTHLLCAAAAAAAANRRFGQHAPAYGTRRFGAADGLTPDANVRRSRFTRRHASPPAGAITIGRLQRRPSAGK